MIDNRIFTFLELCKVMNYHKTAENLNITQPAVTQHIKYLEGVYHCKLFDYSNRKLTKTPQAQELERYARAIISLNNSAIHELALIQKTKLNIGTTKTIGEYMLEGALPSLLASQKYEVDIVMENTEKLLQRLDQFEVDLLMIEGYVDKQKYLHKSICSVEVVGICSPDHPFAGREVQLEEVFEQNVVLREADSGTRRVFERFLVEQGYSLGMFEKSTVLSSNKLIEKAVQGNSAISFVYSIIPQGSSNLDTFRISGSKIFHELNYVFTNRAKAVDAISLISPLMKISQ